MRQPVGLAAWKPFFLHNYLRNQTHTIPTRKLHTKLTKAYHTFAQVFGCLTFDLLTQWLEAWRGLASFLHRPLPLHSVCFPTSHRGSVALASCLLNSDANVQHHAVFRGDHPINEDFFYFYHFSYTSQFIFASSSLSTWLTGQLLGPVTSSRVQMNQFDVYA
jgi:hypothetical protein